MIYFKVNRCLHYLIGVINSDTDKNFLEVLRLALIGTKTK